MKRASRANFSGLWEAESVENYEAYLVACGYNVFRRKLALLHLAKPTQFYKHRGDEMEFSQMQQGRVMTSYMRIGERTEVELPDGSTTFVVSSWEGNTWLTVDDSGELETRRWLDGDTLFMTETRLREGEAAVTCKRAFCWVASDPIWNGQSDDLQVLMTRTVTADEEEFLLAPEDHPPPVIKEVVKSGVSTVSKGASLVSSISSTLTSGWNVLETILTDKPPAGEKDWHSVFNVDRKQKLLGAFNCALSGHAMLPGKLYIFEECIGFYSTLPANTTKVIRASDMTDVVKTTVALTSALEIRTLSSGSLLFTNFLSRDQAHELASKVMWAFSDATSARPSPVALGFSGERYLFVRVSSARPSSSAEAFHSGMSDCFVKLCVGNYTARSLTVENSTSPQFDTVLVFPCTVIDPSSDLLTVSLHNENMNGGAQLLGDLPISLSGVKAAPTQQWRAGSWRAPSAWHKLEMAHTKGGDTLPQSEVSLAMWTGSSTDPAFRTARPAVRVASSSKSERGNTSRLKTYEEPRMAYLFLQVQKASGLKARQGKPNGMSDPFCHVVVGKQRARTRIVQDTLNPVWNDSFTFVVEKPLSGSVVLELYDGDQQERDFIGQVVVPLQDVMLRKRGSRTAPSARWYRVTKRRDKYDHATSRMLGGDLGPLGSLMADEIGGGDSDEALREHLGELELVAYLDSDYLPQEADQPPIGQLSVEVVRARQLERLGGAFAVAHYGRSWARLPTVSSSAPEWRQELLFPVRDMGDVLAVGLFREAPSGFLSAAGDEFLGKACVRPGTLLPGRKYRRAVPLLLGHKDGVIRMGVLDLSIKFVRYSATATMTRYLSLPLPSKCYMEPPAESTAEALPEWEEALVEAHLSGAQTPLPPSVQRAMRPMFDPRLSMRLLRIHVGRLLARFASDRAAGPSLLDPEQWWKEPHLMVLLHIAFVFLVFNPQLLLPLLLASVAAMGFKNSRAAPAIGADPWLSTGGQFAEAMTALRGGGGGDSSDGEAGAAPQALPAGGDDGELDAAGGEEWSAKPLALAERTGDDPASEALDTLLDGVLEEADGGAGSKQLSAERQKKLFRALALYGRAAQQAADHYATRLEQVAGVFSWKEPLVSRSIFSALLLAALALFFIPLRSVVVAGGLYVLRHPALRAPPGPSVLPFFLSRLSSQREHVV